MARAVGLDIGARIIKVVELGGSPKSLKVQRLAVREIPPPPAPGTEAAEEYDAEDTVVELIDECFRELQLPRDDVCASFDSGITMVREITVPFFEENQIAKVVNFEAENHLHNHAIEEVVVNWIKTGETRDGSRLTIFASPKIELARRMAVLKRAGIEPASVDLDASALFTTLETIGAFEEYPDTIVLDVGAHTTKLMMIVDGRPRVMRSFMAGVGQLPLAPALESGSRQDDLLVPAADLEAAGGPADEGALAPTDAPDAPVEEFVRKLHREAIRSLGSVRTDRPMEKMLLLGGGALVPGLPDLLGRRFGMEVEVYDLSQKIDCRRSNVDPEYVKSAIGPAAGLGLRMMGRFGLGLELLQDEFAPKNTFDVVKTALATAVTLLFALVLGWTLAHKEKLDAAKAEERDHFLTAQKMYMEAEFAYAQHVEEAGTREDAERRAATRARLAQDPRRIEDLRYRLRRRLVTLEEELGLASSVPRLPSALKVWMELYKAIYGKYPRLENDPVISQAGENEGLPPTEGNLLGEWVQIQKLDIREESAQFQLLLSDRTDTELVKKAIRESPYFRSRKSGDNFIEEGNVRPLDNGYIVVSLTINFQDPDERMEN